MSSWPRRQCVNNLHILILHFYKFTTTTKKSEQFLKVVKERKTREKIHENENSFVGCIFLNFSDASHTCFCHSLVALRVSVSVSVWAAHVSDKHPHLYAVAVTVTVSAITTRTKVALALVLAQQHCFPCQLKMHERKQCSEAGFLSLSRSLSLFTFFPPSTLYTYTQAYTYSTVHPGLRLYLQPSAVLT